MQSPLFGKKVLITLGPTQEPIDPVRFISNHSSGKMGLALANAFVDRGSIVHIVAGPVALKLDTDKYKVSKVITAEEMYNTVAQYFEENDVIVFAAAVADYTPIEVAQTKIKKKENNFILELKKTKDIAKEMGLRKKDGQFSVGFALETDNEQLNALDKLKKKNFDMIVLNSMQDKGAGFQHDTNKISILDAKHGFISFDLKTKEEVAFDIINHIEKIVC